MKKKYIVKKSTDFTDIIKNGRYYKTDYFTIYIKDNTLTNYRFGISVSKKIGNAVTRNKIKRQMRMIIDNYKKNYQKGKDYIIIIKYSYISASFDQIQKVFENVIDNTNRINKEAKKDENK